MFAITPRLLLRPGWPEDAPALAAAIGHEAVARMTKRVPWPYTLDDARTFLSQPADHRLPDCLILTRERPGAGSRLIGGVGLHLGEAAPEIGYWLTPDAWGRGFATEAAQAMIDHARHGLGLGRFQAGHFTDNPASGRVLHKLGFRRTGTDPAFPSRARGGTAEAARYALDLQRTAWPVAA